MKLALPKLVWLLFSLVAATGCLLPESQIIAPEQESRSNAESGETAGRRASQGGRGAGSATGGKEGSGPAGGSVATKASAGGSGGEPKAQGGSGAKQSGSAAGQPAVNSGGKGGSAMPEAGRSNNGGVGGNQTRGAGGNNSAGSMSDAGTSMSACASSVCKPEFPCQELDTGGYTCRGQFADWSPQYTASTFEDKGDGTVADSRTGLVWQRLVPSSYAPVCSGKDTSTSTVGDTCTWEHAKMYCAGLSLAGSGWRLPTQAELESIVDDSRIQPPIDLDIFPGTPRSSFWSSTPSAGNAGNAWYVSFGSGASGDWNVADPNFVRCVR